MADYSVYTDEELLEFLKRDDQIAFAMLYERYWDKIFVAAINALHSKEEAEECVQDIFCSLWNRRMTLELRYSLYTYLSVAVKYRVINLLDKAYRRKQGMAVQSLDALDLAVSSAIVSSAVVPSAEAALLEKELFEQLEQAVNLLPEKCRIVFRMSREQGLSHKQIAEELQISEKTVNNHITKALKDLQGSLSASPALFLMGDWLRHL